MMGDFSSDTWFPVVTLILGIVLKSVFDLVAQTLSAESEAKRKRQERLDIARLQRADFQRETLVELQEVAFDFARLSTRAHLANEKEERETGDRGKIPLGEEINGGLYEANRRLSLLSARVRNEEIRKKCEAVSIYSSNTIHARGPNSARTFFDSLLEHADELNEEIGNHLRSLDDIEDHVLGSN